MAVFNPSPGQPNDPNYLNYARVTEGPAPKQDTSVGQALAATGEGISGAAGVIDTSIKKGISDTVYDKVDKERDKFTGALEQVKSQLDNGQQTIAPAVQTGGPQGTARSLIMSVDDNDPDLPSGLESGLSRIQQLNMAKQAGSIKINDTQYAAQTLSVAKQLRAQYPGYREYIDDTVSKASGLPVANSYYQNLMIDINRQLNQIGKQKDDVGNLMQRNMDVPQMGTFLNQRAQGDPKYPGDAAMLTKISDWQNLQTQQKIDAAKRAESKDDRETQGNTEEANLTRNANNLVAHHMSDLTALSGMPTLRELITYFNDVSAHRRTASDQEVQQRAAQLQVYRNYIAEGVNSIAQGPNEILGPKRTKDIVDQAMSPIDTFIKFANDKETGPGYFHLHQNAAIKEDEQNNWLISKDRGAISRQLLTARGILGEQYFPEYLKSILVNGQDKPFSDLFSQEALSAVAPYQDTRSQPIGPNRTAKDAIAHAKEVGVQDPEFYGKMVEWTGHIADPNLPAAAKDRLINWAFSKPQVIDELRMDYRDPNTGQMVPGKYRAFNIMTSPGIVQSVAETAKIHPENYEKFKNWTETEFGSLFRTDLQNLNQLTKGPLSMGAGGKDLQVHYSYDDTTKQIGLVDQSNRPVNKDVILKQTQFDRQAFSHWQSTFDTIDRVNGAVQSLKNVQLHNPQGEQNTDRYLIQTLQTAGFRPGENFARDGILKAIGKTKNPAMTDEQLNQLLLTPGPQ